MKSFAPTGNAGELKGFPTSAPSKRPCAAPWSGRSTPDPLPSRRWCETLPVGRGKAERRAAGCAGQGMPPGARAGPELSPVGAEERGEAPSPCRSRCSCSGMFTSMDALPPPRVWGPSPSAPMGAEARGSPFPAGAEEVQTVSPLVVPPVCTHLARTPPRRGALAEPGTRVCGELLHYRGAEPQEPLLTTKADLNAKVKYIGWTHDLS